MAPWVPRRIVIDFRKIKRTFEVRQSRESRYNSEKTHHDVYELSDPQYIELHRRKAQSAIEKAYDQAMNELEIHFAAEGGDVNKDRMAATSQDTVLASCSDVMHHPETGAPCLDSFLLCLTCGNAVASPRHLPRLVAVREMLDDLRSAYPADLWHGKFDSHFHRLVGFLDLNTTPQEQEEARLLVTEADRALIRQALTWRVRS